MKKILPFLLVLLLWGCDGAPPLPTGTGPAPSVRSSTPPASTAPLPTEPGPTVPPTELLLSTEPEIPSEPRIDTSRIGEGCIWVYYPPITQQRLKAQLKGPGPTYTFDLTPGRWAALPLSCGDGVYTVNVLENVTGSKYALLLSQTLAVTLTDPFAPFLHPNQYVDYSRAPNAVAAARDLCTGLSALDQVAAVYGFVVEGMRYDHALAATVQSGYLPDLDAVLAKRSGICFDYAALMAGMLRSQNVPCKLVVGYAGDVYHAWISVWTRETGWVEGIVFFDGTRWQRMDPTFASSGAGDPSITSFIQDDANYREKWIY